MLDLQKTFKTMELSNKFFTVSVGELGLLTKQERNRNCLKNNKHISDLYNGIKDVVNSVNSGDTSCKTLFESKPLIVSKNTLHILDAQNRIEAIKRALQDGVIDETYKVVIYFEDIAEEDEYERIVIYNTIVKSWQLSDFIDANLKVDPRYQELRDFANKHELLHDEKTNKKGKTTITPKYRYAAACICGKTGSTALKRGEYTHTDEELKNAKHVHDTMNEIFDWLGCPKNGSEVESAFNAYHTKMDKNNDDSPTWGEVMDMDWLRNNVVLRDLSDLKKKNTRDWLTVFKNLYTAMCQSDEDYYLLATKTELNQRDAVRRANAKRHKKSA